MAFVLDNKPRYKWPVEISIPNGDGRKKRVSFMGEFARLTQSRLDEINLLAQKSQITDNEVIEEIFQGWEGVEDTSGNPVEVTPSNRRALLDVPGMRAAIIGAFFDSIIEGARKN